jgi:Asp-tRNA(Asn)/Glu-tRNA(Gln) amidotransferase A subunit family amidase
MNPNRRELLASLAALGIGPAVFHRAAVAIAAEPTRPAEITAEMVKQAEWVASVSLTDNERIQVARNLTRTLRSLETAHNADLTNDVAPAFQFDPTPGAPPYVGPRGTVSASPIEIKKPSADDDIAFLPVTKLAHLVKSKQISSVELTKLYLDRLRKYDPVLKCVITFTDDTAMKQAKQADDEIAAGKYRSPLHGIPWGAKDLVAVAGHKTTWGAGEYKDQVINQTATVAKRLEEAGAVLVAKLTLGALANNDIWFGGRTNNPWNIKEGSSGSSAGPAAATVAGLVGFTLGSETLGSIVSPSTRCGATGLRPTFGRVSRYGCMALCWTMDKIGPICRSVEDCALVLGAIHGADGLDPTALNRPFSWPAEKSIKDLKIGYTGNDDRPELKVLKSLGATLEKITLPSRQAATIVNTILNAEAGAAFDSLARSGKVDNIGPMWPTPFRAAQFVTAVDYIRANRIRSQLMSEMAKVMEKVDLYVGGNDLIITNLTGHPTVCLPNGFTKRGGADVPTALTFTGRLYGEENLLHVAKAYQDATGHHLKRPPQEKWIVEPEGGEKKGSPK